MMSKTLSTEQYIAISWLAQPKKGGKTYEEIAEICAIHPNTLANWRKEPTFERELKTQMVRNSQDKLPELIESLADIAIRDGNAAMAKLALQINGLLTDKIEVETRAADVTDTEALRAKLEAFKQRNVAE
ncbi:phBC6A51 family helix-turn-helix protein [Paenibacillus sp. SI8]|uniref:phBC6A51 family helix-turn-helix protein n=1 Tax=unclassified Paenibacillus TaxID=185978 RepID=UPI003465B8E4